MPEITFAWTIALSTLSDALVAAILLAAPPLLRGRGRSGPGPRIGAGRLLLASAATALFFAAKVPMLAARGVYPFGLLHLVYIDLVGLIPALGLALLAADRLAAARGAGPLASRPALALAWASPALAAVGIYATFWEPSRLRVEETSVPVASAREGRDLVRVAVLADLQTSRVADYERGAIARLMALRPDLIVIPGDLFQGSDDEFERELPHLRDLLSKLSAPGGVYFTAGDVDQHPGRTRRMFDGTRVERLDNRVVRVVVGDRKVSVLGVDLDYAGPATREAIEAFEGLPDEGDLRILVAHRPDVALGLRPGSRIDLTVAGHTHGGQVVVPGFGPPMTLSDVPRAVAAGGLHELGGNRIYVSRGVGCERGQAPRIRFLCPPEVSLLAIGGRDG